MDNLERRRCEYINSALTSISKSANLCKQYLDENEAFASLQELNKCVERYCIEDIEFSAYNKVIQDTENLFKDPDNIPNTPLKETFKNLHEKQQLTLNTGKDVISQHRYMIQYIRDIQEAELEKEVENPDDGIVASNSFVPPIDPITKTAIKNPVRNSQCGHIYENDSIRALIRNKNTRCPYIGCPAFQYIQIAYLQPDNKLKKRIDHYFLNH